MRRPRGLLLVAASTPFFFGCYCCGLSDLNGNSSERCDRDTYQDHCEGNVVVRCGRDHLDLLEQEWVYRRECDYDTETCVQDGDIIGCAVSPPERCFTQYEKRCINGLEQTCDANDADRAVMYWKQYPAFSCGGS